MTKYPILIPAPVKRKRAFNGRMEDYNRHEIKRESCVLRAVEADVE
jgi:hypothetical protein